MADLGSQQLRPSRIRPDLQCPARQPLPGQYPGVIDYLEMPILTHQDPSLTLQRQHNL